MQYRKVMIGFLLCLFILYSPMTLALLPQETTIRPDQTGSILSWYDDIQFVQPVEIKALSGTEGIFVVERQGRIYHLDEGTKTLVLDISAKVDSSGNEMGLLGLAFHPEFELFPRLYVDYTAPNPRRTVISQYSVGSDLVAYPSSELIILEVDQPYSNHNAGTIVFGPDSYLYITLGDGGSGGDPENNGQDTSTLLGSILRIDISTLEESGSYGIPDGNPFVDQADHRGEIYAYGLRNPWKISFDPLTDVLYAADVGQNRVEEVNIIEPGGNYGWNHMEGTECYIAGCDHTEFDLPVTEYTHEVGNSITGGYVIRETASAFNEFYIFGDFGSGKIFGLNTTDLVPDEYRDHILIEDTDLLISTFGQLSNGQVLVADYTGGKIYLIEQSLSDSESTGDLTPTNNGSTTTSQQNSYVAIHPVVGGLTIIALGRSWRSKY